MICPLFTEERNILLQYVGDSYPNVALLNKKDQFIWLMSQEDFQITKLLAKTITLAFRKRENIK